MDIAVLSETKRRAFEGTMTFPETVKRLAETGVERYDTDLVRMETTYYSAAGVSHVHAHPFDGGAIADRFDAPAVRDAIGSIQKQEIRYPEFLRRIMTAGVVGYSVSIAGRRALYFGRRADFHVEEFPSR